ncbi:MAG TPA: rhomboid family intramembrane serine protease [Candidatus Binataceae bacterium]|nr:rhomboid family intramembrane serine protease [Candidatus Binataceae bacterium]
MIPLRDNVSARRLLSICNLLIASNVAVFIYEIQLGSSVVPMVKHYGMVPARLEQFLHAPSASTLLAPLTLLTSIFIHGDVLHIAGNMLFLYIFGAAVEDRFGHARFLIFYLAAGVVAGLAMTWMEPASRTPMIGASGAIAGVLGSYFVLYPRARILTLLPLVIFIQVIEVPALLYLLLWFAFQLYAAVQGGGGVAWWAHVGGFLFGVALAPLVARASSPRRARALW